jgi:hypothetical protein
VVVGLLLLLFFLSSEKAPNVMYMGCFFLFPTVLMMRESKRAMHHRIAHIHHPPTPPSGKQERKKVGKAEAVESVLWVYGNSFNIVLADYMHKHDAIWRRGGGGRK